MVGFPFRPKGMSSKTINYSSSSGYGSLWMNGAWTYLHKSCNFGLCFDKEIFRHD